MGCVEIKANGQRCCEIGFLERRRRIRNRGFEKKFPTLRERLLFGKEEATEFERRYLLIRGMWNGSSDKPSLFIRGEAVVSEEN